jgi:uncharacterized protein
VVKAANGLRANKVAFGSDFPVIEVDRWRADFETLEIKPEVAPFIFKTDALGVLGIAN